MSSAFGEWFDAQFPDEGRFSTWMNEALCDLAEDGRDAEQELLRRRIRREQERAALYAWHAAPPSPSLTDRERVAVQWAIASLKTDAESDGGQDAEAAEILTEMLERIAAPSDGQ